MNAGGEGEVAEVVGRELQLPALPGSLEAAGDQPGIVEEQVKRAVPRLDKACDGDPVREVEPEDAGPNRSGRLLDRLGDRVARGRVPDGERHLRARGGQRTAVSLPMPEEPPVTIARTPVRSTPWSTSSAVLEAVNGVEMGS